MESLATPEDVCQDFSGVKLPFYLKDDFTRQNVNFSLLSACGAQLSHLDAIAGSVRPKPVLSTFTTGQFF
jgi:hypothetical protein